MHAGVSSPASERPQAFSTCIRGAPAAAAPCPFSAADRASEGYLLRYPDDPENDIFDFAEEGPEVSRRHPGDPPSDELDNDAFAPCNTKAAAGVREVVFASPNARAALAAA